MKKAVFLLYLAIPYKYFIQAHLDSVRINTKLLHFGFSFLTVSHFFPHNCDLDKV